MKITEQMLLEYYDFCRNQKKLSEKTLKAYAIDLKQFYLHMLDYLDDTDKKALNNYLQHILSIFKAKTTRRKVASLNAFFAYLVYEDILEYNPLSKIQTRFKDSKTLPRTIPLSYLNDFFKDLYKAYGNASSDYQKFCTLRDIAIFELLISTGLRISELCSLELSSINFEEKFIRIIGKGRKERILQIGEKNVYHSLINYHNLLMTQKKDSPYFFINKMNRRLSEQSVRNTIHSYINNQSGKMNVTPHMFRHTFASLLLEENVDIRFIQQILGHSSITTTQIYTHISSTKQTEIMNTLNPRNFIEF